MILKTKKYKIKFSTNVQTLMCIINFWFRTRLSSFCDTLCIYIHILCTQYFATNTEVWRCPFDTHYSYYHVGGSLRTYRFSNLFFETTYCDGVMITNCCRFIKPTRNTAAHLIRLTNYRLLKQYYYTLLYFPKRSAGEYSMYLFNINNTYNNYICESVHYTCV